MKLTGNTIFITGGASGIGRGLAEAFHRLGNQVIISGRRRSHLETTVNANPGMRFVELDVTDPVSIEAVCGRLVDQYPKLNVLINNAGVMALDDVSGPIDDNMLVSSIATNFMAPVRLTAALIAHLKRQEAATVVNVSSGMGFVPFALGSVYSASKAALHAYSMTLRYQLKDSSVRVLEVVPPWVQTELLNSSAEPRAMPFADFIEETMALLGTDADEILVERVRHLRANPGADEGVFFTQHNRAMLSGE